MKRRGNSVHDVNVVRPRIGGTAAATPTHELGADVTPRKGGPCRRSDSMFEVGVKAWRKACAPRRLDRHGPDARRSHRWRPVQALARSRVDAASIAAPRFENVGANE